MTDLILLTGSNTTSIDTVDLVLQIAWNTAPLDTQHINPPSGPDLCLEIPAGIVVQGPKGEKGADGERGLQGEQGAGSDFKVFSFDPVTISDQLISPVLAGDQASTVVTESTIGGTGTGSPTFSTPPLNYESASTSNLAGGSFTIHITTNYTYQLLMFHKPHISTHDLMSIFTNGGSFPAELGFVVAAIGFGSPTPVIMIPQAGGSSSVLPTLVDPSIAVVQLADGHIAVGDVTMPLDLSVYSSMTYIVTQTLLTNTPVTVSTFDFNNHLLAHDVLATPIPAEANDGDALVIVRKGVVLGKSVNVFDVAWLYGGKTSALVFPRYPVGLAPVALSGSYLDLTDRLTSGYGISITAGAIAIDQTIVATRTLLAQSIADLNSAMIENYNGLAASYQLYTDTAINGVNNTLTSLAGRVTSLELLVPTYQGQFALKANQSDLDATNQAIFGVTQSVAFKANQSDFDELSALVDSKASKADLTAAVGAVVGAAPAAFDALNKIADRIVGDENVLSSTLTEVGTKVSYTVLQSLTSDQMTIARFNIGAEKSGTAAGLIALITPASISAATATQGTKADTALQSGDVAPVAISGNYLDLLNLPTVPALGSATPLAPAASGSAGTGTSSSRQDHVHPLPTLAALGAAPAVSFNQSRWMFFDFDSSSVTSGFNLLAINGGTISYPLDDVSTGVYGVVRLSSSTTANSGYYFICNQQVVGQAGLIQRLVFRLSGTQPTRLVRIGYSSSLNQVAPVNGAWIEISGSTAVAKTSTGSIVSSAGSALLTNDTWLVADIEFLSATKVRFVITDLATFTTKPLDQTISTNVPNKAANAMWQGVVSISTGTALANLCDLDFIGRGIARPSFIAIPP